MACKSVPPLFVKFRMFIHKRNIQGSGNCKQMFTNEMTLTIPYALYTDEDKNGNEVYLEIKRI